jgi:acyl carrier protein
MEETIRRIMADVLGVPEAAIDDEASPATLERWDSLNHMNLVLAIEQELGVELDAGVIPDLTTFAALCGALRERLGEGARAA